MYGSAVGMIEKSNIYGYIMSGVEVHDAGTAPMRVCACLGGWVGGVARWKTNVVVGASLPRCCLVIVVLLRMPAAV